MRAVTLLLVGLVVVAGGSVLPWATPSRISGGSAASISQYPHATALLTNFGSGTVYVQACGGTILTTTSVLSSASCFVTQGTVDPAGWWRARVGSSYGNAGGTVHLLRLITPHEDYEWSVGHHDLAILRTSLPFTYVANLVGPASIAGAAYTLTTHQEVSAIGWGQISENAESLELRDVQFWVVNHETCFNRYNAIGFTVTDDMICAGWLDVGVRAQCQGDAGSSLMHQGAVVGVYTWTAGECAEGWFPGINIRIAAYTKWIITNAAG